MSEPAPDATGPIYGWWKAVESLKAERNALQQVLREAPPLVGVWTIDGHPTISEGSLAAFIETYNAWAERARQALSHTDNTEEGGE